MLSFSIKNRFDCVKFLKFLNFSPLYRNSLLIKDMTAVAEKKNFNSRFACIVRCLHFKDKQITVSK